MERPEPSRSTTSLEQARQARGLPQARVQARVLLPEPSRSATSLEQARQAPGLPQARVLRISRSARAPQGQTR
jgi:hypothetical protein